MASKRSRFFIATAVSVETPRKHHCTVYRIFGLTVLALTYVAHRTSMHSPSCSSSTGGSVAVSSTIGQSNTRRSFSFASFGRQSLAVNVR
ncbi:hypothetical protein B0J12DRAFT_790523 [Macrophomina phaseolina]|uniref:Secreted protein n=1 Tax=Macrophomina phaseolina TaxID=35725 RepID=A0ABQ8FS80_9PEZI|nr:hypothetical protein B0J12DRAFT_790523 [Macrophomina phaseolina]